ncbi:MAG: hypothetical protein NTV23_16600 [Propionibacteriales bacterium]|nr:hypothetical protein [Propionibacteriales bacterium]
MSSPAPSKTRRFTLLGLVVLLVLGVGLGSVLLYRSDHLTSKPYSLLNNGDAIPDASEGRKAVTAAEQYILRLDTLDTAKLQEYLDGINQLSTTKSETNSITAEQFEASLQGQKFQSKGLIVSSALRDQDIDSATVLVLHIRETVAAQGTEIRNLRAVLSMQRVNGTWLVDDIQSDAASQSGAAQ